MTPTLEKIYRRLSARYGLQQWSSAQTPIEILIGTILSQNTSRKNVEQSLDNLREAGALEIEPLGALAQEELEELIQPAGQARIKARRLRKLLTFVRDRYDGSLEAMFAGSLRVLREQLLELNGIGPETADSILLYAGKLPSFVVDTSTYRIMARHGWIGFESDYDSVKDYFESSLAPDPDLFGEFHALLARVGRGTIAARRPSARNARCAICSPRADRFRRTFDSIALQELPALAAHSAQPDRLARPKLRAIFWQ
jgi:endonuclease-3 related protein